MRGETLGLAKVYQESKGSYFYRGDHYEVPTYSHTKLRPAQSTSEWRIETSSILIAEPYSVTASGEDC